ncbi:histidine kinase A domain protein, partial [Ostertagia ostertagi]
MTSGTDSVQWNIYGKATDIENRINKSKLHFVYDGAGQRIQNGDYVQGNKVDQRKYYHTTVRKYYMTLSEKDMEALAQKMALRTSSVKPGNYASVLIIPKDTVKMVQLSAITTVNGQAYKITSKAILVEPEDIYLNGIILVFAWTFVFLLALVVVLSEVLSWYILKPFNDTLEAIQQFQINQEKTIAVHDTQTSEFKELNAFLVKMTNKARSDYIALKEFSENASHELQTPIATMKAKIELLMETPLEERQLNTLSEIHNELERVSRINHSLTLLAKLEHFDLDTSQQVDFRELLQEVLSRFADWIEMKDIKVTSKVNVAVAIMMDASLAQMVLNNL